MHSKFVLGKHQSRSCQLLKSISAASNTVLAELLRGSLKCNLPTLAQKHNMVLHHAHHVTMEGVKYMSFKRDKPCIQRDF